MHNEFMEMRKLITIPKHPCVNCVYFKECGENTRIEPCAGRTTKSERKNQLKSERRMHESGN